MHIHSANYYMNLALTLAQKGRLTVSPNPMVGCVLVSPNDQIIGQGFHVQAGKAHAEINALNEAGKYTKDSTAFITLEPCCHHGKTPPCTEALIQAGIKKIYIACLDPNPLVAGKGVERLKAAGIEVKVGLYAEESKKLNEIFFHYMRHNRPFIFSKWAMSLDGKTVTHLDDARQISSHQSQIISHEIRQITDAILIGANTAIKDDPSLTVRYADLASNKIRQPQRIVLSATGRLPQHLKIFNDHLAPTMVVTCAPLNPLLKKIALEKNIAIELIPREKTGNMDLIALVNVLGKRGMTSLLVEGGMRTHELFFHAGLVNKIHVYLSPVIIAKLKNKKKLSQLQCHSLEHDYYFIADC